MPENNSDPTLSSKDKCILIVDDEPANIMLIEKMLSLHGYTDIKSTLDSEEVAALCQNHHFSLILLDINMPKMDGFAVLEQLRCTDDYMNTPVIAISGDIYPVEIEKGMDAGFSDYVTKPMKMQALVDVVEKYIND